MSQPPAPIMRDGVCIYCGLASTATESRRGLGLRDACVLHLSPAIEKVEKQRG
jgi:hypothetical protein